MSGSKSPDFSYIKGGGICVYVCIYESMNPSQGGISKYPQKYLKSQNNWNDVDVNVLKMFKIGIQTCPMTVD